MEGVTVQAAGRPLLQGIDLDIPAGAHVAIVGASGAGKSTLVGLLLGWHAPAAGAVLVDGQPLDPHAAAALRRSTAWVDPAVQLWNRTAAREPAVRKHPRRAARRRLRGGRCQPSGTGREAAARSPDAARRRRRTGLGRRGPARAAGPRAAPARRQAGRARRAVPRARPRRARAPCCRSSASTGATRRCSASATTSARPAPSTACWSSTTAPSSRTATPMCWPRSGLALPEDARERSMTSGRGCGPARRGAGCSVVDGRLIESGGSAAGGSR